jgi:hypothetical protein
MKKQAQRKNGSIALLGALVLTLLGLGACANPLQGPNEKSPDGSTGVQISIVTGGERTLLPSVEFTGYSLDFTTSTPGVSNITDQPMTGTTVNFPLAPAIWNIKVTAYARPNNVAVPVAEGTALNVTLVAGEMKGVPIRIGIRSGGAGTFSYDIKVSDLLPGDPVSGNLTIYNTSSNSQVFSQNFSSQFKGSTSLSPGYYRVLARLETDLGMASRTEIAHIYSGMETPWSPAFSKADFGVPIEIKGAVNLSGLGTVTSAGIVLYSDSNFSTEEGRVSGTSLSGSWQWTIRTLPFNQPTDLYVDLTLNLADGQVKRLPAPFSVYDKGVTAPTLGPFTVNTFELGGTFNFDEVPPSINPTAASALIFYGGQLKETVSFTPPYSGVKGWSHDLFGEANSPVRIVLKIDASQGSFYSEIQETLTDDLDSLVFDSGMISAGIPINGTGVAGEYSYLFHPDTAGVYAFTVNSDQNVSLSLVTIEGSASGSSGVWNLDPGLYLIKLGGLAGSAFQIRVDPVTVAELEGTIDFTGLLSSFAGSGVTLNSGATITIYTDTSDPTALVDVDSPTFNLADGIGTWSKKVYLAGATPAVVVINATLSNGQSVSHQEYLTLSEATGALNFSPKAVTGAGPVFRTTISNNDQLLYVPAKTAFYSLGASAGGNVSIALYDAVMGGGALGDPSGSGKNVETAALLTAGHPYRVHVSSSSSSMAYQFRAEELAPVTLKGSVSYADLAALTGGIKRTEIQVYAGGTKLLDSPVTVAANRTWTVTLPPALNQTVRIVASVYLNNNRIINSYLNKPITKFGAEDIVLAPKALASEAVHDIILYAGAEGTGLLWIPEKTGEYALDTKRAGNVMEDPYMYLYDGITGAQIAADDNGGGGFDSRIQRSFTAGYPYLIWVTETYGTGTFTFKALPSLTLSGTVSYTSLTSLTDEINRTDIQVYNAAGAKLGSPVTAGNDGVWTATLSPAVTAQTVRIVASVHLKKGGQIDSPPGAVNIAAGDVTKPNNNFAPAPATSGNSHTVYAGNGNGTWLLWIPAKTGEYLLDAVKQTGDIEDTYMYLYDALAGGASIASNDDAGENDKNSRIRHNVEEDHPYLVQVRDKAGKSGTFKLTAIPPAALTGTVNLAGLSALDAVIDYTEIQVYDTDGSKLGSPALVDKTTGEWTATVPPSSADRNVNMVASVYLKNGGVRIDKDYGSAKTISTGAVAESGINFAPVAVTNGAWHDGIVYAGSGGAGTWLLWIPTIAGEYVLDATATDMDTYMYLYDALNGNQLAADDNGGTGSNSHIQHSGFAANHPYLVQVKDKNNAAGTFTFTAVKKP